MPLAVVKTNLQRDEIPFDFMERLANAMVKHLDCDISLSMVELHTDIQMLRNGSRDPMVNLEIHHNTDRVTEDSKRVYGAKFAEILFEQLRVSLERVLVLFIDTRRTVAPRADDVSEETKF